MIATGRLIARTGRYRRYPIIGLMVLPVGLWMLSMLKTDSSFVQMGLSMFVVGVGIGLVMQVLVLATQNAVDHQDLGVATSAVTFFRSMGGAVGVAVFGAIMSNRLEFHIPRLLPDGALAQLSGRSGGDMSSLLGSPEQIRNLPPAIMEAIQEGFARSLHVVFLVAIPAALIGLVIVLFLREQQLRTTAHVGAAAMGEDAGMAFEFAIAPDGSVPDLTDADEPNPPPSRHGAPTGS